MCLFEESHCSPALLKEPVHSTELVAIIFFEKYLLLNARKHLQPSHFNFTISQLSFSEEQLYAFALARATFGTGTLSKELLFRSTCNL